MSNTIWLLKKCPCCGSTQQVPDPYPEEAEGVIECINCLAGNEPEDWEDADD